MLQTSARLLRLLSLLQTRPDWTGPELAERLGVTARTVRRDVDRLRELGYPVHATLGAAGGYRLGAGAALPPLLLDDEEAVAVAVGLRTAAGGTVEGMAESSVRALAKLEQVLPSRLRRRVNALQTATVALSGGGPTVDPQLLTVIASACRDRMRTRFHYQDHGGAESRRIAEPHRLVCTGWRWYLVAWDTDRDDWRTFRVDRITEPLPTGPRFEPRELPEGAAERVSRGVSTEAYRYRARVTLHAPAEAVRARTSPTSAQVEPLDEHRCTLRAGANSLGALAIHLALFGVEFEVHEPPELVVHLRELAERMVRATGPTGPASPSD
ncbi:helix-turn-helix transcriptional regulator [Peterkaempfera bronchialis]|uniref:helix-turn-helix transcriptional regulator n=1 Tax=Peterkaempfera bronchialis TaxID=2126346 RepID=UPI0013B42A00|nr:YafY family protein [Peterkaempfera bronchialis]